jgi:hypothetical protein
LLVKKEVVGELAVDDVSTPARKKVKWSSKLNNIRIFSNTKSDKNTDVAVEKKKKVKSKSLTLTWRSKKKNRKEERHQDENANVWEDMKQAGLSVTLDNHVLCASPAWDNNMCNFQEEVKSTMLALTEGWNKRELDNNKSVFLGDDVAQTAETGSKCVDDLEVVELRLCKDKSVSGVKRK